MANSGIPSNELNTRISIDDMEAVESLRGLKSQVGALMNSWKAQNAMLESAGEHLAAAKTRYEGLGDAIIKQNEVIEKLKSEQSELDTSTTHGAEVFAKLQKQVALAGKQLANMQAQQKRAGESMAYYQAGVDKANEALASVTAHSKTFIGYLEAQGRSFDAAKASVDGYKEQLAKLNDLANARSKELNQIASEQGTESEAYKKTAAELDNLSLKIAQTAAKRNEASDTLYKYQSGINKTNEDLDTAVRHNDALVKSLDAQGKHSEAAKQQAEGLATQLDKLNSLYDKEKTHLDVIANSQGTESEAYKKTAATVDNLAIKIAATKKAYDGANNQAHAYSTGINDLKEHLNKLNDSGSNLVERLKAQGKNYQADAEQAKIYKSELADMATLYAKQSDELSRLANDQGKDSEAYKKAASSLDELKTQIEKTKAAEKELDKSFSSVSIAKARDTFNKIGESTQKIGDGIKSAAGKVAGAAAIAGGAVTGLSAGFIAASNTAAKLQNNFNQINNLLVTGGEKAADATKEVSAMQKDARKYSIEYGKSQQSIADAYEDLVKRGYTGKQAIGAMNAELQASVASGDDFSDVVKVTSGALEGFNMKADSTTQMIKNTNKVTNTLAYIADKTSTGFKDLGIGLSYVGSTAQTAGITLGNTTAALGVLSNRNLEASKAGTGLRDVINSITASFKGEVGSTNEAAKAAAAQVREKAKLSSANQRLADLQDRLNDTNKKNAKSYKKAADAVKEQQVKVQGLQATLNAVKNIKPGKQTPLEAIGINPKDLTQANGKLKSLSDIFDIINAHTKNMSASEKAGVFTAIFGTTGANAAKILAQNTTLLKQLDQQSQKAYEDNYVAKLAKKNEQTAQFAVARFKQTGESLGITLSAKLLPVVSDLSDNLVKVANSKGFQQMIDTVDSGVSTLGTHVSHLFDYIGKHSKDVTSIGKSIASIIGELGSGVWSFFKTTIKDIGDAISKITGKKINTSSIHGVAQALSAIAKNKSAIEAVGKAIAAYFATKKLFGFASAIGKVGKGFIGLGKIVANTKPAKTLLEKLLGAGDKTKLTSEAANTVKGAVTEAGAKAAPEAATTGLSIGKGIAGKLGAGLGIAFNAGTAIHGLFEKGKKKYEDVGSGVAGTIGGAVGMAFGGPVGSMIGSTVGSVMGRVGGDIAHKAVAAWHKAGGWKGIQKDISNFCATMGKNIGHFANDIGKTWANMGNTLNKITGGAWNNITSSFNKGKNDITHIFSDAQSILTSQAHGGANARINAANDEYHREVSISNQKMHDTIKDANSTCEQTIAAAERKRSQTIAKAQDEYENQHSISYSQYQSVVNNANQQCKESVDAAKDQRNKTVEKAQDERDKVVHEAHEQRDKRIQAAKDESHDTNSAYEDMLQHMANIYNGIAKGLNNILDKIDGKKDTIPMWHPSHSYATGTSGAVNGGELALVGEEGFELAKTGNSIYPIGVDSPEIRWLPEGTQILPHDMSKAFSSLAAGLPHYKKGKDKDNFLSDAIKWTKGKIKDVADLVHKGADKVVKELFKTLGWDSYQKSLVAKVKNYTVEGAGKHIRDAAINELKSIFSDWASAHEGGGVISKNIGAHAGSWAGDIRKIADEMHVSVSDSDMQALLARIQKESGGDQSIKQQVWDVNMANGDPAQGLFQYIPPTFAYWSVPGHNNILSGDDQIRAVFNDSNWRSDIRMPGGWSPTGHRVFANGGIAIEPSIFGDAGAEMAIPLTTGKRSRAYELLGQLTTMFASEDGLHQSNTVIDNNSKIEKLLEQNNKLMNVLINIASGQLDQMKNNKMPNNTAVMKKAFYNAFGMDSKLNQFGSFN